MGAIPRSRSKPAHAITMALSQKDGFRKECRTAGRSGSTSLSLGMVQVGTHETG